MLQEALGYRAYPVFLCIKQFSLNAAYLLLTTKTGLVASWVFLSSTVVSLYLF